MPELPTCECVGALPPMAKWGAIAQAANQYAGTTAPAADCAQTLNDMLDSIYCAFYTLTT